MRATKYRSVKTEINGVVFASKAEASRFLELRALESSGAISGLALQPSFEILPAITLDGKKQRAIKYTADFEYLDALGNRVIEDVKGMPTREYRLKRRLMKQVHGIEVKEVRVR